MCVNFNSLYTVFDSARLDKTGKIGARIISSNPCILGVYTVVHHTKDKNLKNTLLEKNILGRFSMDYYYKFTS
jgi:hypothetical protein